VFPARNRGAGELGLERKKGSSTEREGRGFPDRRQPSPFAVGLVWLGCSATAGGAGFHGGEAVVRERVEGKQMSGRGVLQRRCGALFGQGGLGAVCTSTITVGRERWHSWSGVVS
jgi:hypothetical protein